MYSAIISRVGRMGRSFRPELWLVALVMLIEWVGVGAIMPVRTIFAEREGANLTQIGLMASSFLLTSFVLQIPFGGFSDRAGRYPLLLLGASLHVFIGVLYPFVHDPNVFIAMRMLEGASSAAFLPSIRALVADLSEPAQRGAAYGILGGAMSGGTLLGPAIGGFLAQAGGFPAPFIFNAVSGVIAVIVIVFWIRRPALEVKAVNSAKAKEAPVAWGKLLSMALLGAYFVGFGTQFGIGLFISLWNIWLDKQGVDIGGIGLTYTAIGLPTLLLMPYAGRLADTSRRKAAIFFWPALVVAFVYVGYGLATGQFWLIMVLSLGEAVGIAFTGPIIDRYLANAAPSAARGRTMALYGAASTTGGFVGSLVTPIAYGWSVLAPFVMIGAMQFVVALVGGYFIRRQEKLSAISYQPSAEQVSEIERESVAVG